MFNLSDIDFSPWIDYAGRTYEPDTLYVARCSWGGWEVMARAPGYYDGRLVKTMARPFKAPRARRHKGFRTRRDAQEVCRYMREQACVD